MARLTGNSNSFTEISSVTATFGRVKSAEIFKSIDYNIPIGKVRSAVVVKNPTPQDAVTFDPYTINRIKPILLQNPTPQDRIYYNSLRLKTSFIAKNPSPNDAFLFDPKKISQFKVIGPTNPTPGINLADVAKLKAAQVLKASVPREDIYYDPYTIRQFKNINNQIFATLSDTYLNVFDSQYWFSPENSTRAIVGQVWPKQTLSGNSISVNLGSPTTTITFQFPTGLDVNKPKPKTGDYLLLTDSANKQSIAKTLSLTDNGGVTFTVQFGQVLFASGIATGTGGSGVLSSGAQYQHTWTCPANVYNVCVVCVGAGSGSVYPGGGGGALAWANNIAVVPGQVYTVYTGVGGAAGVGGTGGNSSFNVGGTSLLATGGIFNGAGGTFSNTIPNVSSTGGGNGGAAGAQFGTGGSAGGGGGGGAGGYNGAGGAGGSNSAGGSPVANSGAGAGGFGGNSNVGGQGGGGVGVLGIGSTGTPNGGGGSGGGTGASGGFNGSSGGAAYGGGAGGATFSSGADGAVRIIWPATRVANGAILRAFGATAGATVLATDSSSTITESLTVFTATVATADIANIIGTNNWTVQPWDPEVIPQINVRTNVAPTNPRERLYYATLANTKYGQFIPFKDQAIGQPNNILSSTLRQSKYQNFVTLNSPLAVNDKLEVFSSTDWYRRDNSNIILVGSANTKSNPNNVISTMTSNTRTASGSNSLITVTSNTYYGSFNGSQLLTTPANAAFSFGAGDFTIEAYVFPLGTPAVNGMIFGFRSGTDTSPYLFWTSANQIIFGGDLTNFITYSPGLTLNTWTHIAVTRSGTNLRLFLNGIQVSSVSNSTNFSDASTKYIGGINGATPYYFTGFISNLRVVKGTAVYTGLFTPSNPLSRIQPARNNVAALTGAETSLLTLQSPTVIDNSIANAGVGFTITNPNSVATTLNSNYSALFANPFVNEYVLLTDAITNNQALAPVSAVTIPSTSSYVLTIANSYVTNLNNSNPWYVQLWDPEVIPQSKVITTLAATNPREILYYVNLLRGNRNGIYFPGKNEAISSSNNISLNRVDNTILQSTVSTTLAPTNPRERLYYANLVKGKYGYSIPTFNPACIPGADYKFDVTPMTNLASNYWTYFNNRNKISVGQPSGKLVNYSTVSTKTTSGSNILLTINNPTSGINYITSGQTYYGTFNGSTQTLTITSSNTFASYASDFTIEAWIRPTAANNSYIFSMVLNSTVQTAMAATWYLTTGGFLNWYDNITGLYLTSTRAVPLNSWSHVAVVRENNTVKFYINGQLSGTATYPTVIIATFVVYIGSNVGTATTFFAGDISNFRMVKTSVYKGDFIPLGPLGTKQIARPNVIELGGNETSLLALQSAAVTTDNSINNLTIVNTGSISSPTLSNILGTNAVGARPAINEYALITDTVTGNQALAQINGSQTSGGGSTTVITGTYSAQFNGTNQYLTVPSSSVFALSGDFTIEGWFYKTTTWSTTTCNLVEATGSSGITFYLSSNGTIRSGPQNVSSYSLGSTTGLITNTWYHFAFIRKSNSARLYVNGLPLQAAVTDSSSYVQTGLGIGGGPSGFVDGYFDGYISNLRIVNGTAVYDPASATINVPTSPLTAIANTSLLTLQNDSLIDNSVNNFTITNNNSVTTTSAAVPNLTSSQVIVTSGSSYIISLPTTALSNLNSSNTWAFSLWDPVIFPQTNVLTNTGPQTARERLYYATLAKGRYGQRYPYERTESLANNVLVGKMRAVNVLKNPTAQDRIVYAATSLVKQLQVLKSPTQVPTNYRLSDFNAPYTYFNNTNKVAVGTYSSRLYTYATISSKTTVGSNTALTVTNPSSNIPYITRGQTYYTTFNGSTQYLSAAQTAGIITTGPFTIEAWVYPTSLANTPIVVEDNYWNIGNNGGWNFSINTNGTLILQYGIGTPSLLGSISSTGTISINTWSHIAVVRDINNFISFYINGQLANSPTLLLQSLNLNTGGTQTNYNTRIGAHIADGAVSNAFTGSISNVRIVPNKAVYTGPFIPLGPLGTTQIDRQNVSALGGSETSFLTLQNTLTTITGQQLYTASGGSGTLGTVSAPAATGTQYIYSFTTPAGVTSVSAVAIGGGGGTGQGGGGGAGGGLAWVNNITVIPNTTYTVAVGAGVNGAALTGYAGDSYFISPSTVRGGGGGHYGIAQGLAGGTYTASASYGTYGGGNGGSTPASTGTYVGGGGAGGYNGAGGAGGAGGGGNSAVLSSGGGGGGGGGSTAGGSGGGVGVFGIVSDGTGGTFNGAGAGGAATAGSGGSGTTYGAGTGGGGSNTNGLVLATSGAVRIIWGPGRAYGATAGTTTLVTDQSAVNFVDGSNYGQTITNIGSIPAPTQSTALSTVPVANDFALITDTVTGNQTLSQIDSVTSIPLGSVQITQGQVTFDGAGTRSDGGVQGTLTTGSYSASGYYTYSWTCPAGVYSVSVVTVGAGGGGGGGYTGIGGGSGGGGGGGGLGYRNNISVIPGVQYTVVVGVGGLGWVTASNPGNGGPGGDSYFINTSTVKGGGGAGGLGASSGGAGGSYVGTSGGSGGTGGTGTADLTGAGGGGAAGYGGNGGNGGYGVRSDVTPPIAATAGSNGGGGGGGGGYGATTTNMGGGGGGGVGLSGQGSNGAAGSNGFNGAVATGGGGGSNGTSGTNGAGNPALQRGGPGGLYGGGGGGGLYAGTINAGNGGVGAVKIIWPAVKVSDGTAIRSFPSTLTSDLSGTYTDVTAAPSYTLFVPSTSLSNLNSSNTWTYSLWDPEVFSQSNVLTNLAPANARERLYYSTLAQGRYGQRFPFESPATITDNLSVNKLDNTILQSTVSTTIQPANARERLYYASLAKGRYGLIYPFESPATLPNSLTLDNLRLYKTSNNGFITTRVDDTTPLAIINQNDWYSKVNANDVVIGQSNPKYNIVGTVISKNIGETTSSISFKSITPVTSTTLFPKVGDYVLLVDPISNYESIAPISSISIAGGGASVFVPIGQTLYDTSTVGGTLNGNQYTFTWTAPTNVYNVAVVAVGAGGGGSGYFDVGAGNSTIQYGGAGGGLGWGNNIPVVPGQTYTVLVGAGGVASSSGGTSSFTGANGIFISASGGTGGTYNPSVGGTYSSNLFFTNFGGGTGGGGGASGWQEFGGGGGGAGGYGGTGGVGGFSGLGNSGAGGAGTGGAGGGAGGTGQTQGIAGHGGGGVGVLGVGTSGGVGNVGVSGAGGSGGGSGGYGGGGYAGGGGGGSYGGGAGAGANNGRGDFGGTGSGGAVRIIYPANSIANPSTVIRAFGSSSSTLATDQSGSYPENLSVFTITVPTSSISKLDSNNSWSVQFWDPEVIPQALVTTPLPPINPRERLYWTNLTSKYSSLLGVTANKDTTEVVYDRDTKGLVVKFRTAALGQGVQDPAYKPVAPIQFWN